MPSATTTRSDRDQHGRPVDPRCLARGPCRGRREPRLTTSDARMSTIEQHLDHERAEAVEHADRDRAGARARRRAARSGPRARGGRRSWGPRAEMNWTPYWSISTGQNRISCSVAPIVENACGTCEMGDRSRAASSHHQSAFWNSSTIVSMPMFGEGGDQRGGEERDHGQLEERLPRDALQRLERRDLGAGALRDLLAQAP